MSSRKNKILVMTALCGTALVVACGGGSGPVGDIGSPYDQQGGAVSNNPVASDRDPSPAAAGHATGPQTSGEASGTSGATSGGTSGATSGGTSGATSGGTSGATSGGTSGATSGGTSGMTSGGTSGTMAGCPPCDGSFTCTVTVTGSAPQQSPVTLSTKNGVCVFPTAQGDVVFACGGALTQNGQNVGTWANCGKTSNPPTQPDAG